jgi:hypothetical protein
MVRRLFGGAAPTVARSSEHGPDPVHVRPENIFVNLTNFPSTTSLNRPVPAPPFPDSPSAKIKSGNGREISQKPQSGLSIARFRPATPLFSTKTSAEAGQGSPFYSPAPPRACAGPRNTAFRNRRFIPSLIARKLGSCVNPTTTPLPDVPDTTTGLNAICFRFSAQR